jgi:hypothetical protein
MAHSEPQVVGHSSSLGEAGCLDASHAVLVELERKVVAAWTAMVGNLSTSGKTLFGSMEDQS